MNHAVYTYLCVALQSVEMKAAGGCAFRFAGKPVAAKQLFAYRRNRLPQLCQLHTTEASS